MFMKGIFMLFISLGLGYVLCVLAKRQEGILKTLGYALGISILVLSLLYGLEAAYLKYSLEGEKAGWLSRICGPIFKSCPFAR